MRLMTFLYVLLALLAGPASAQLGGSLDPFGADEPVDPVTLSAEVSVSAIAPGDRGVIAVVFEFAENFHAWPNEPVIPEALGDFFAIPTEIDPVAVDGVKFASVVWPEPKAVEVAFLGEPVDLLSYGGTSIMYVPFEVAEDATPGTLTVQLEVGYQACDDQICLPPELVTIEVSFEVGDVTVPVESAMFDGFDPAAIELVSAGEPASSAAESPAGTLFGLSLGSGLLPLAILAALGGMILNLTPCVLPVIPIKILTLTQHAGDDRGKTLGLGFWMFLGVTAFWAALGIPAALLTAFADPSRIFGYWFITAPLGILMVLLALGLMGLFQIQLPQKAYAINPKADNASGSFLFGVMTGVLGLPCFGFVAGALIPAAAVLGTTGVIVVFTAMGVGMAAPYLVLAAFPQLVKRVPKTGPASDLVKQVLGLILAGFGLFFFGTGIRALVATYPYTQESLHVYALAALVVAAGLLLAYRTMKITKRPVPLTVFGLLGLALAAGAVWMSVTNTQKHRADYLERRAALADAGPGGILPTVWNKYTPALLQTALDEGKIAFIDFTADWCINCKVFEAQVLDKDPVRSVLRTEEVAMIKVDLTGSNPDGDKLLADLGRVGIPTWAVMGPGLDEPLVITTFTPAAVQNAIEAARGTRVTDATP